MKEAPNINGNRIMMSHTTQAPSIRLPLNFKYYPTYLTVSTFTPSCGVALLM
jgi:hypothetical protein